VTKIPSHGSLSKAGKQRALNKKGFREEQKKERASVVSKKYWHKKKHKVPKASKRRRYNIWYNETYVVPKLIAMGVIRGRRRKFKKSW